MSLQQKNIALVIGFLILVWISYVFSFSKTLDLKKRLNTLKNEAALLENSTLKIQQLSKENQYYDSILKAKQISSDKSFQNNLLTTINSYTDTTNVKVVEFKNPHSFRKNGSTMLTYSFSLKGNFNQITQLIYILEQQFKLGKIISVNYTKKRDYRKRKNYLECTILLQRIS